MNAFAAAGAGFLLAVLWFDLMFDVQVVWRGRGTAGDLDAGAASGGVLPEAVLSSIAAYYARVTTAARPMNRLVAAVMLATLAALVVELTGGEAPGWVALASLVAAVAAIGVAGARTVPGAVRLGTRRDPLERQSELARAVLRQHAFCFAAIAIVLVLQLGFA